MTTAQSPVEVLRAALEQIEVQTACCKRCSEVARNALAEADALAAEVPGRLSNDSTSVGNRISAAPPPAPVPGGMSGNDTCARCSWPRKHHSPLGKYPCDGFVDGPPATPPEVVVGMPTIRNEGAAGASSSADLGIEAGRENPVQGNLPPPPSDSTPPVQQQGEACGAYAEYFLPGCQQPAGHAGDHGNPPSPEAPTPPLGKAGPFPPSKGDVWRYANARHGVTEWTATGRQDEAARIVMWSEYAQREGSFHPADFTDGTLTFVRTGSRPPTDSQGGGR